MSRDSAWRGLRLSVLTSLLEEGVQNGLASAARGKETRIGLENTPGHSVKVDLRPTSSALCAREFLKANPGILQHRQRGSFVGIIGACHAECAASKEKFQIPSLLVLLPQLEGAGYHLHVKSVRRTVGCTDCPSLAA
jgi:hypothetical protein